MVCYVLQSSSGGMLCHCHWCHCSVLYQLFINFFISVHDEWSTKEKKKVTNNTTTWYIMTNKTKKTTVKRKKMVWMCNDDVPKQEIVFYYNNGWSIYYTKFIFSMGGWWYDTIRYNTIYIEDILLFRFVFIFGKLRSVHQKERKSSSI